MRNFLRMGGGRFGFTRTSGTGTARFAGADGTRRGGSTSGS